MTNVAWNDGISSATVAMRNGSRCNNGPHVRDAGLLQPLRMHHSTVAAPGINPTAYGSEEGYFTMKPNWITFRSDLAVLPGGYIFLPFVKGHDDAYQTSS